MMKSSPWSAAIHHSKLNSYMSEMCPLLIQKTVRAMLKLRRSTLIRTTRKQASDRQELAVQVNAVIPNNKGFVESPQKLGE